MVDRLSEHLDAGHGNGKPKRRLLSVALLPSAATLGNLLCGVLAIMCCLLEIRSAYFADAPVVTNRTVLSWFPTYVAMGVYLIVLAMIFDALDGRLARITRHTTEFGAQLDSLADIVSFGVAPALLYLTLLLPLAVPNAGDAIVHKLEWRMGLISALVYVSCSAIRLARFNVENVEEEAAQHRFHGLPTPGAAAALSALILVREQLVFEQVAAFGIDWGHLVRWSLGPASFTLGVLMVSRLDYVHVFHEYVRREHPPSHLVGLVILVGIGLFSPQILLAVLALAYVASGILLTIKRRRRWHSTLDTHEVARVRDAEVDTARETATGHRREK